MSIEIHTCSYHCHRPACIKAQRDELRDKLSQRQWVGLTDDEIEQGCRESWVTKQAWQSAVWWAEEKLKEKNALMDYNFNEHEQSVNKLELSVRAQNVLRGENIQTIGQLIGRLKDSDQYLFKLPNCGKVTEREIKDALKEHGFSW